MRGLVTGLWVVLWMGMVSGCEHGTTQIGCPEGVWSVEYTVSGGIAGVERQMTLDSTGRYNVHDSRSGEVQSGIVECEVIRDIAALYESAESAAQAQSGELHGHCADCFTQTLVWKRGEGKPVSITVEGLDVAASPYRPLLERLHTLLE